MRFSSAGTRAAGGGVREADAAAAAEPRPTPGSPGTAVAPVRGRRRPWLIGLGALLASLGALTVVWLVGAAGQRQEVLVIRADVGYGQELTSQDLTLARVSVDPGVAVMPWSQRDSVIGQVAATRLGPGMLLSPGMVQSAGEPSPGRVLVPLALRAHRLPAAGLQPGDRIMVVGSAGSAAAPIAATVAHVGPVDIDGVAVVDVTTTPGAGPELAAAAANGDVALVLESKGR